MLSTKIHAAQITNLTDARYFAAKEVEWLTFNFRENSDNYIEPIRARAMFEWVEGVKIVGEFAHATTAAEVNFYAQSWGLKHVQVSRLMPISEVFNIEAESILYEMDIEAFTNPDILRGQMKDLSNAVEAFVLNFEKNGLDWTRLQNSDSMITFEDLQWLGDDFNIILSIDFQLIMLPEVLSLPLYGLSLKGGEEERVGVKSFDDLDTILEQLEVEI